MVPAVQAVVAEVLALMDALPDWLNPKAATPAMKMIELR
jgi:hypothetical protein